MNEEFLKSKFNDVYINTTIVTFIIAITLEIQNVISESIKQDAIANSFVSKSQKFSKIFEFTELFESTTENFR